MHPTLTRRYEIAYLTASGTVACETCIAPATPAFEQAFSALARGTVIATMDGPVAVEDIEPGMKALTAEDRAETITWIGSMTIFPRQAMPATISGKLIRVTSDAFGVGRPMPDLVLGPSARFLVRGARGRYRTAADTVYAPAASFVDGFSIIEVAPVAPVTVYHLMLERHGSVRAAGIEIESCHPGALAEDRIPAEHLPRFMGLFPHLGGMDDFGAPAHPRLSAAEVEAALAG